MNLNTSVRYKHEFRAIKAFDGYLFPTKFTFSFVITPTCADSMEFILAYRRMNYWLTAFLDEIIIGEHGDALIDDMFQYTENTIMTIPTVFSDNVMMQLIFHKIAVICGGKFSLTNAEMIAEDSEASVMSSHPFNDLGGLIPSDTSYMEGESLLGTAPWWCRDDHTTFDVEDIGDDVFREEFFEGFVNLLEEYDNEITRSANTMRSLDVTQNNSVADDDMDDAEGESTWTPKIA